MKNGQSAGRQGFTLVEVMVAMAIVAIVGTILVAIFANTLRGSSKAQMLSVIKQNGQSVLENMDKTIRNADNVVCVSSLSGDTLVIVKNGLYLRTRWIQATATSNGLIQQDEPAKQIDPSTGKLEGDTAFISRVCDSSDPLISPVALTDTELKTGVSLTRGLFVRSRESGFKDSVTVDFDIGPPLEAPQDIDPVNFKTTVQLR